MSDIGARLEDLKIERGEAGRRPPRRWLLLLLLAALLLVAAAGWWLSRPAAARVRTATARATSSEGAATVLNASGYVTARRQATVSSKVTGKVVAVFIEEGMEVAEGQVLARLDPSNVAVSLRLAEAQLQAARTASEETRVRLAEAKLELDRTRSLRESGVASQADLDRAAAERDWLAARLARQAEEAAVGERLVAFWRQEVEDRIIRAPFDGVVVSKNAQPGEMISPVSAGGGFTRTGICTLVDMGSLEIEVDVNEAYINRVAPGQPVAATLDAYSDWKIPASVIAIVPTADRQRATVRVRVGFDRLDPRILPDMGVKVAFQETTSGEGEDRQARVSVPAAALWSDGGSDVAWVLAGGTVERRAVAVEEVRGQEALLSAGLSPGERVVIEPPETLSEGDQVKEVA